MIAVVSYTTCRTHTMSRFLNHDGLAHGIFNRDYSGATGSFTSWDRALVNSPALLQLLVNRMNQDWTSMNPKMRKPWGLSTLDTRPTIQLIPRWH